MALFRFEGKAPLIGRDTYVSESAQVIGEVIIGDNCYIGHGAIIRGDYGRIEIGSGTAVEEGVVIHVRPEGLCSIGEKATIGHGAVLHNRRIGDYAVVGLGAVVGFDAEVGDWAIIGEGGVVRGGQVIPPGSIAVGVPVRVVGEVTKAQKEFWLRVKGIYVELARRYLVGLERIA